MIGNYFHVIFITNVLNNCSKVEKDKTETYLFNEDYWSCKREPGFDEVDNIPQLWQKFLHLTIKVTIMDQKVSDLWWDT